MTAKQIVHGLRCSATYRGDPVCDGCPYLVTETVPDSLRKLTKKNTWDSCDVDRIALDAAELIEELAAMAPRWIPVAERLPEDRSDVLVVAYWHERWGVYMGWCAPERAEWSVHIGIGDRNDTAVTHWMPLPEAPKED